MADFGLYQGLQRKSNIFETKAANRKMELQINQALEQRELQKLEKETQIDAKMQEFFKTVEEIDILQQDKERVSSAEKRARADVMNLIKKYNGDLNQFYYGGGAGALEKYKNNVMQSEEVKTAIGNKMNYAQWAHAQANGLFVKDVSVDLPIVDEEGNVKKGKRKVSMDEAYELFEKGHINKLPYDGAEKDIDVGPEIFQKLYKDPRNPYSQDTLVAPEDVYLWVKEHGGSDDQAKAKQRKYIEYVNQGGTEWRYRSGDILDKKIKEQRLANMRQRYKMNRNAMKSQMPKKSVLDFQTRIRNAGPGEDVKLLPEEEKFFAQQFGFIWDKDSGRYKTTRNIKAFDRMDPENPQPANYNLKDFSSFYPEGYHIGPKGEVMLKLRARTNPNLGLDKMPVAEEWIGTEDFKEGALLNNWDKVHDDLWTNSIYEGNIYVPITDYYTDNYTPTYINKQINARDNIYGAPFSSQVDEYEQYQNSLQLLNNAQNAIMGTTGLNEGGAAESMYNYATQGDKSQQNPYAGSAQAEWNYQNQ